MQNEEPITNYNKRTPAAAKKESNSKVIKFAQKSYNNFKANVDSIYNKEKKAQRLQDKYTNVQSALSKAFNEYKGGDSNAKYEFDELFDELTKIGAKLINIDTILSQRAEYKIGHNPKSIKLKDFYIKTLKKKTKKIKKNSEYRKSIVDQYNNNMTNVKQQIYKSLDENGIKRSDNEVSRLSDYHRYSPLNPDVYNPNIQSLESGSQEAIEVPKTEKFPNNSPKSDNLKKSPNNIGDRLKRMSPPAMTSSVTGELTNDEKKSFQEELAEIVERCNSEKSNQDDQPVFGKSNQDDQPVFGNPELGGESINEYRKKLEELIKEAPAPINSVTIPTFSPKDSIDLINNEEDNSEHNRTRDLFLKEIEEGFADIQNDIDEYKKRNVSKSNTPPIVFPTPSPIVLNKPIEKMTEFELKILVEGAEQIKNMAETALDSFNGEKNNNKSSENHINNNETKEIEGAQKTITDYDALRQLLNEGYTPEEVLGAAISPEERIKFANMAGKIEGEEISQGRSR